MYVKVQAKLWSFLLQSLRLKHEIVKDNTEAANVNLFFPPLVRREYIGWTRFWLVLEPLSLEFQFLKRRHFDSLVFMSHSAPPPHTKCMCIFVHLYICIFEWLCVSACLSDVEQIYLAPVSLWTTDKRMILLENQFPRITTACFQWCSWIWDLLHCVHWATSELRCTFTLCNFKLNTLQGFGWGMSFTQSGMLWKDKS